MTSPYLDRPMRSIERAERDIQAQTPTGFEVRHDMHGYYVCTDAEAEHEDKGRASAGFDGREHFPTIWGALAHAKRCAQ